MKNRLLKFGIISGLIVSLWIVLWSTVIDIKVDESSMSYKAMEVIGYLTMVLAFVTIFIANKRQMDETEGAAGFWPLLRSGFIISIIAAIIYVATWMVVYENGGKEHLDTLMVTQEQKIADSDLPDAEKTEEIQKMKDMMDMYKSNAIFRIGFTFIEILPVGVILSLVSSLIFFTISRRKPPDTVG